MDRLRGAFGAILAVVLLFPAFAAADPTFPPLTGRVVDDAQLLSPQAEAELTAELAALEQQTGHQLVVATLPDLQGYEIEDYGYRLLRAWGIGRKDQNDGAILIVAPAQRKVRIEVGYGLEPVLTDAVSSLIIQRSILPAFRAGNLEQGVVDGTRAIARQIGLPPEEAKAQVAAAQAQAAANANPGGGIGLPLIFVILIGLWVLSGVLGAFRGRRGRGGGLWWLLPLLVSGRGRGGGWSGDGGGFGGGGFGGGGFSGGGGSGGGGGASGSW